MFLVTFFRFVRISVRTQKLKISNTYKNEQTTCVCIGSPKLHPSTERAHKIRQNNRVRGVKSRWITHGESFAVVSDPTECECAYPRKVLPRTMMHNLWCIVAVIRRTYHVCINPSVSVSHREKIEETNNIRYTTTHNHDNIIYENIRSLHGCEFRQYWKTYLYTVYTAGVSDLTVAFKNVRDHG